MNRERIKKIEDEVAPFAERVVQFINEKLDGQDTYYGYSKAELESIQQEAQHSRFCHLFGLPLSASEEQILEAIKVASNDEINALHRLSISQTRQQALDAIHGKMQK